MEVTLMSEMIEVPLWYLVAAALAGAIVGMSILLLAIIILGRDDRRTRKSVELTSEQGEHPRTEVGKPKKVTPSSVAINITSEGFKDLGRRASRRSAYQINDAAELLGVTADDVMRWIRRGELASFIVGSERFVTPAEIKKLLGSLGVSEPVYSTEPSRVGSTTEKAPRVVRREVNHPSRKRLPPPPRQHFWYFVEGVDGKFTTLREACRVAGHPLPDDASPDWRKVPVAARDLITREPV